MTETANLRNVAVHRQGMPAIVGILRILIITLIIAAIVMPAIVSAGNKSNEAMNIPSDIKVSGFGDFKDRLVILVVIIIGVIFLVRIIYTAMKGASKDAQYVQHAISDILIVIGICVLISMLVYFDIFEQAYSYLVSGNWDTIF